jgi:hypothetical protein
MKTMRLSLLVLLAACGSTKEFTPCGLGIRGEFGTGAPVPSFSLEKVSYLERLAIEYNLVECKQLRGYHLDVRTEGNWDLYHDGHYRAGSTYCNILDPRIEASVLSPWVIIHEMHHVAQGCESPPPTDDGTDFMHSDWFRTGAYDRIRAAYVEYGESIYVEEQP